VIERFRQGLTQPNAPINQTASGENRNCPNDPAAVPAPNASERQLSGSNFANAPITILNAQPDSPNPINTPAESSSVTVVVACAIK